MSDYCPKCDQVWIACKCGSGIPDRMSDTEGAGGNGIQMGAA